MNPYCQCPLCLAPQFVQIFTLLTASTLVLPQTSATQDLQASFDLLSQLLVPLVPLWHRHRLPSPYHCKQGQAADGPHVCRRQIWFGAVGSGTTLYHIPCMCQSSSIALFQIEENSLPCSVCFPVSLAGKVLWRRHMNL